VAPLDKRLPVDAEEIVWPKSKRREVGALGAMAQVWQVVVKDSVVEWRSREIVYTVGLLGVLMVVIFSFAFVQEGGTVPHVVGGLLWVVLVFSGTIGLGRVFDRERESNTISALLLAPVSRGALYLGKLIGVMLFMMLTEAIVVPVLILLFKVQISDYGVFLALLFFGTLGFAAVGSLFAATLMRSNSRQILLGVLTYPIIMPVVSAGAKGTTALLMDPPLVAGAMIWLKLIIAFDLLFLILSMWTFGPLVSSE
jgi:heme exporter protein B